MNIFRRKLKISELVTYLDSYSNASQQMFFLSIGSAANLYGKQIRELDDDDMHQYPKSIETIKNKYNLPLHIILIDERLKSTPYLISHKFKNFKWIKNNIYSNIYYNSNLNINIYVFKQNVHWFDFDVNSIIKSENIIEVLINMNSFCINHEYLMFFHDFSGRPNYLITSYFNTYLNTHKNLIMYDISYKSDQTCSLQLKNPQLEILTKLENGLVNIIEPCFKNLLFFSNKRFVYKFFINNSKYIFLNTINGLYRRYFIIYNNIIKGDNFDYAILYSEFKYVDCLYKFDLYSQITKIKQSFQNNEEYRIQFADFIEKCKYIFENELKELIKLVNLNIDENTKLFMNIFYKDHYFFIKELNIFINNSI